MPFWRSHRAPRVLTSLCHPAKAFGAAILHAASKYIANLDLSALRLSLFGGDVVLRNLELKLDAIRREFAADLPIKFERGFVRELRIRIPWLKLHSEPIELVIDIVELVASLDDDDTVPSSVQGSPRASSGLSNGSRDARRDAACAEASEQGSSDARAASSLGDGWVQNLVSKSLANALLRVNNLVIKFVNARAAATLSVREIELFSAGAQWERAFVEPEGPSKRLRKVIEVADLTLCLDRWVAASPVANAHRPCVEHTLKGGYRTRCFIRQHSVNLLAVIAGRYQADGRVEHFHQPLLQRASFALRLEAHLQAICCGSRPNLGKMIYERNDLRFMLAMTPCSRPYYCVLRSVAAHSPLLINATTASCACSLQTALRVPAP